MIGIVVAILLALVVFWLLSHVSVLLAVVAALLVLLLALPSVYGGRRWPW